MNRCRNCKWWLRDARGPMDDYTNWGVTHICDSPKLRLVINDCDIGKARQFSDIAADELGYSDYEDYNAILRTGPEFGCIHWEQIEIA